ncbi:MAG: hypothetical protein ACREFU_00570 [Acetobacteraceae bacterium]
MRGAAALSADLARANRAKRLPSLSAIVPTFRRLEVSLVQPGRKTCPPRGNEAAAQSSADCWRLSSGSRPMAAAGTIIQEFY